MGFNFNLNTKFNFLLIAIFCLGSVFTGLGLYKVLYQQAETKLTDEGKILMQIVEEVRYFTSKYFLETYQYEENQGEFQPAVIPAYAARKIFSSFQNTPQFEQYQYKEATINPTNLDDKPNAFEQKLIEAFAENKDLDILSGYGGKPEDKFYYISRPMTVKDSSCLKCHSTPDIAPKNMVAIYGRENGFNWQLNQLTSAQTIYIPANNVASSVQRGMLSFMPLLTGVFGIFIFAINRLLKHNVIQPITQLTKATNKLSLNDSEAQANAKSSYLERLKQRPDEAGKLAQAFLSMAEIITNRERDLVQAVEVRTKKLRQEISDRAAVESQLEKQINKALLQEKITQEIRQSLDTAQIFQTAVNNVGDAFKVSRCQIYTYIDTQPRIAKVVAEYIQAGYPATMGMKVSLDEAICLNKAMSQERAVYWTYVYDTPLLRPCMHIYKQLKINSLLTVRTSYQGKVNGAISIQQCDRYRQWSKDDIELMESVAAQVGIALAQANLLQQETDRRHELEAAKQEAEIANQSKSRFLANISHELRTPLNAIIGFSQLMNRDPAIKPEQQETVNIINRSGEHLLEMINEVLEMSKIEAGKTEVKVTDIDLPLLLNTIKAMLDIKARTKNLELVFDCAVNVPQYICTDENKLRQILINLLSNGIKFTQVGKVELKISQHQQSLSGQNRLLFEVIDTGGGISPAELKQIFQAFTQSDTGLKSKEGTGLGLPISKKFVELMGGELLVRSVVNKGSVFSFDLPYSLGKQGQIHQSQLKSVQAIAPGQSIPKILVVDDNWQSRLLIVKLFTQIGFQVQESENGKQAITTWHQWQPDLIWMDMHMPIMDGYEATRYIRQQPKGDRTKIIALTASAFESKRTKTLQAGCDDYLRKPFKEAELFVKLQEHLGIEFIYQDTVGLATGDRPNNSSLSSPLSSPIQSNQLTPESLQIMPAKWLGQLKAAAAELDEIKLAELIEQIPQQHSHLAQSLSNLVSNLQFEQIFALI